MDEVAKKEFKVKFMILVVMLNAVVLMYFLALFLPFILSGWPGIALPILALAAAIVLTFLTWRRYHKTKRWLEEHAGRQAD